jgi:hypothetical protein
MKSQAIHMKVTFENRTYLLNRFPESFIDLLEQVADKLKTSVGPQANFYFVDRDGDMIVVADSSDLANVKEVCKLEGKEVCKLALEKQPTAGQLGAGRSGGCSHNCGAFDSVKYLDFLKKRLPEFTDEFTNCIEKGLPCEDCLGMGKLKDLSKCFNCYGRGIRPMNSQFKLIMQIIDFKLKQLILDPLAAFVNGEFKYEGQREKRQGNLKDSCSSIEDTMRGDQKQISPQQHGQDLGDQEKTVGRRRTPSIPDDNMKQIMDD